MAKPTVLPDRNVATDLAVVCIHVVDGERRSRKRLPLKRLRLLATTKIPSRPKRISLFSTLAPGAFQTETPLPASLMRPSVMPMIVFPRAIAFSAPCRQMP